MSHTNKQLVAGAPRALSAGDVDTITIPGPTKAVVVNANGQLGTAPAGTAAAQIRSASGTGTAQIRRQQHEIDQLQKEVPQLRALIAHPH